MIVFTRLIGKREIDVTIDIKNAVILVKIADIKTLPFNYDNTESMRILSVFFAFYLRISLILSAAS